MGFEKVDNLSLGAVVRRSVGWTSQLWESHNPFVDHSAESQARERFNETLNYLPDELRFSGRQILEMAVELGQIHSKKAAADRAGKPDKVIRRYGVEWQHKWDVYAAQMGDIMDRAGKLNDGSPDAYASIINLARFYEGSEEIRMLAGKGRASSINQAIA